MIAQITFSRIYEILDTKNKTKEELKLEARLQFKEEFEFLDSSPDNFSAKLNIKPDQEQPLKED
jgi:hypothetical protein